MSANTQPTVLVVEDEPDVAETYRRWLDPEYDVCLAADGIEAMEQVDESVEVILLDRMMPKMSGEEVLAKIRERNLPCRVAMVTAVDPDFDLIEMGFDEYVTKPPDKAELVETIESLLERAELDDALQEYYSLVARRTALQSEKTQAELAESPEYAELEEQIAAQKAIVDEDLGDMESDTAFVGAIREIMPDDGTTDEPVFEDDTQ